MCTLSEAGQVRIRNLSRTQGMSQRMYTFSTSMLSKRLKNRQDPWEPSFLEKTIQTQFNCRRLSRFVNVVYKQLRNQYNDTLINIDTYRFPSVALRYRCYAFIISKNTYSIEQLVDIISIIKIVYSIHDFDNRLNIFNRFTTRVYHSVFPQILNSEISI